MTNQNLKLIAFTIGILGISLADASAQQVSITGVSVSRMGKQNLCNALGGQGAAPTITIRHSKGSGSITVSMIDRLNDGRTINHGSTSVSTDPSGTTKLNYGFLSPCNRKTGEGLKSAYYITASAGGSSKTVLWARYP